MNSCLAGIHNIPRLVEDM